MELLRRDEERALFERVYPLAMFICYPCDALASVIGGVLRAANRASQSAKIWALQNCCLGFPLTYLLAILVYQSLYMVWVSMAVAMSLGVGMFFWVFSRLNFAKAAREAGERLRKDSGGGDSRRSPLISPAETVAQEVVVMGDTGSLI